jgi:phosphoglycerate dehydrogenase-like enzyme
MQFVAGNAQQPASLARRSEPGGITTFAPDVRVAVVGYGYWGSKHMRVLSSMPGVHVTIVDQDPERLAEARRSYPSADSAHRLDDVLDRVDAVVVATPPWPRRSRTPSRWSARQPPAGYT